MISSQMKIGELASAAGVSTDTVRYYEKLQLLPRAARTLSGYRTYTMADVKHLCTIKQAQGYGFTLDEIRKIISAGKDGIDKCRQIHDLLDAKLRELDARIAEMQSFRQRLSASLAECEENLMDKQRNCCPALSEIVHHPIRACRPEADFPDKRESRAGK